MPSYAIRCDNGHPFEVFFHKKKTDRALRSVICPRCGETGRKDFGAQIASIGAVKMRGFWSSSLGRIHESEYVKGETYNDLGEQWVRDASHRRACMKRDGLVDRRDWRPQNRRVTLKERRARQQAQNFKRLKEKAGL